MTAEHDRAAAEANRLIHDAAERIDAGFRRIREAREAAGVKPGEPLLGLNLPTEDVEP